MWIMSKLGLLDMSRPPARFRVVERLERLSQQMQSIKVEKDWLGL